MVPLRYSALWLQRQSQHFWRFITRLIRRGRFRPGSITYCDWLGSVETIGLFAAALKGIYKTDWNTGGGEADTLEPIPAEDSD